MNVQEGVVRFREDCMTQMVSKLTELEMISSRYGICCVYLGCACMFHRIRCCDRCCASFRGVNVACSTQRDVEEKQKTVFRTTQELRRWRKRQRRLMKKKTSKHGDVELVKGI